MAHLPQDELPSEFDVVVDGTGETYSTGSKNSVMVVRLVSGLVQSILAAALARAGKTVLHLDR